METVITIISSVIAAGSLFVAAAVMMRTRKNDFAKMVENQSRQALLTEQLVTENRNMSRNISTLSEHYSEFTHRVLILEQSITSAWKRIDELVGFTGMVERER
jgi:hypothetical protein